MFIVTKEIDSENISKLCRTCLREDGEKMVCIFVGPAGSSLAAKLRSLSCLEVWQGDGLPEKMCDRCVTRAESALLYREQCRAADRALRQAALKVSGFMGYPTMSGCKYYQQNSTIPLQNSPKTWKCVECGILCTSYQELCLHQKVHFSFVQDTMPLQHMHIVESQNLYSDLHSNPTNDHLQNSQLLYMKSNVTCAIPTNGKNFNRTACALHCSLCNHTFMNRTQLITHNITHDTDNLDLSNDEENIETNENSDQLARNHSYDRPIDNPVEKVIQDLSYQRSRIDNNDEAQNLSFSDHIELDSEQGNGEERGAMLPVDNDQSLRFLRQDPNGQIEHENCLVNSNKKIEALDFRNFTNSQREKYTCEICSKVFQQKSKLLTHVIAHSNPSTFKCNSCPKVYASKSKLNAHVRLHTRTNVHQCKFCNKIFAYPSYLEEHLKTHQKDCLVNNSIKERPFECTTCKQNFKLMKNLKSHEKLHTGKGLLHCNICDKQFTQNYNLKMHLRMHKTMKEHTCEYCDKSFVQKGNLVEHLRIHLKIKPFECKLCNKRFAQSSHLKSHEASHTSVRKYQCKSCGKRFKLANHLKRHLHLHTGTKLYKCEQCNQMFSQAFSLKRHLKRHDETPL